jgi:hypothetical protein
LGLGLEGWRLGPVLLRILRLRIWRTAPGVPQPGWEQGLGLGVGVGVGVAVGVGVGVGGGSGSG